MKHLKLVAGIFLSGLLITTLIGARASSQVKVIYAEGRAEFLASGATNWKDVTEGLVLRSGDSVKTYNNSTVELAFDRGKRNIVNIKSNTHVVIKLHKSERIELVNGEVFALVKSLPGRSRFEIRTPTAVTGARGTGWGANANKSRTIVKAYEKDSYAKGLDKDGNVLKDNMTVKEGNETTVKRFEKPSKLKKISKGDYKKWRRWKKNLAKRLSGRKKAQKRLIKNINKITAKKERMEDKKIADRLRRAADRKAGQGRESSDSTSTEPSY